jgi:ATP-binding cassette subfamily B protein
LSLAIICIFLVKGFATYGQDVTLGRIGNRIVAEVQRRLYNHVLGFDLGFFTGRPSSELIARVSGGANAARDVLNMVVISLGRDLLTLIGLLLVMIIQAPLLSAISLVIAPLAILGVTKLIERVRYYASLEFALATRAIQLLQETVYGARIIKAFNLDGHMRTQMDAAVTAMEARSNKIAQIQARTSPLMETLGGIAIGLVTLYSGWRTLKGGQTPGEFMSFITALLLAYEPAKRLARLRINLEASMIGVRMMYELLDLPQGTTENAGAGKLTFDTAAIEFRNVHFAYRPPVAVLRGISFRVPSDSKIALVGPSGGGKTTILGLLQRFYEVSEGQILVDGSDIQTVSASSLRDHMSFVSQDTFLFSGTLRDNIRIGRLGAPDAEVEQAARDALAHDFIAELPKGYDTDVGENGVQLSGGQRQRIAIARALLKGAPILLLDEATSALDSESERTVQRAFDRLMEGRTTIVIAHRLSTVMNADRILVIDRGQIVEEGTHRDLVGRGGLYTRLYRQQFTDEAVTEPRIASA